MEIYGGNTIPGLTKGKRLGTRTKLAEPKRSKPELMEGEGSMGPRGKQVILSRLRKGDDFKLFGRTFQVDAIESGKVTARDAETGAVRTFKPSLRVAVVEMGSESACPPLS